MTQYVAVQLGAILLMLGLALVGGFFIGLAIGLYWRGDDRS